MSEILLIDGEQPLAQDLASSLEKRGYNVKQLENGKEGLAYAQTNLPALIVLCVELPKPSPSGYAICNKLKKDGSLKKIPLVITSKEATPETFAQHRKLKTRAEEYVLKPFGIDDIISKISDLVPAPKPENDEDAGKDEEKKDASDDADAEVLDALDGLEEAPDEAQKEDGAADEEAGPDGEDDKDDDKPEGDSGTDDDDDLETEGVLAGLEEIDGEDGSDATESMSGSGDEEDGEEEEPTAVQTTDPTLAFLLGGEDNIEDTGLRLAVLQKMNTLRREASDYKAKFVELEAKLKIASEMARSTQANLAQTKSSSSSSAREALELKKKLQAKEKELLETKDETFQKEETLVDLQEKMDATAEEVTAARQEAASKDVEIASLNSRVESLTQAREDLEAQVNDRLKKAEAEVRDLKKRLDKAKKKSDREISELRLKLEGLQAETQTAGKELSDAYTRIKGEETLRQRAKQALDVALTVLSAEGQPVEGENENEEGE